MFISNTKSLPALYDLWIEDQFDALMTKDSLQQNSETVSENEFSQCDPHLKASPSHMNQYTSQLSFWIKVSLKIFSKILLFFKCLEALLQWSHSGLVFCEISLDFQTGSSVTHLKLSGSWAFLLFFHVFQTKWLGKNIINGKINVLI